jgi:hypothetical protein
MQHREARQAVEAILLGTGFDRRAQALVEAAELHEHDGLGPELAARCLDAARALPPDQAGPERLGSLPMDPPEELDRLLSSGATLVLDHPADTARQIASLHHLGQLWPFASRSERQTLWLLWLSSMTSRVAPVDSYVTRAQLRQWQRNLPTTHINDRVCAEVLGQMLQEDRPEQAYTILAGHLGIETDLPTLSWTLGVLVEQILLRRFDPRGWTVESLSATVACERLSGRIPPETLVTLVSQLAHHIWWCRQESARRVLDPRSLDSRLALADAVAQGDIIAAERAARLVLADRPAFWEQVRQGLRSVLDLGQPAFTLPLATLAAVRWRAGLQGHLSPDDAASIAATLAAAAYLGRHPSQRITRLVQ